MVPTKPKPTWTLEQWLNFLEQSYPSHKIQLGLERVLQVAQRLEVIHLGAKIITVAGTNGKGSTVNALETIYHCAGYNVGSYTSPHLIHFNERIKVNLNAIDDNELCEAFLIIETIREEIELSYFERATLAALYIFKQKQLDVIILEVGLGGRLDATNIIDTDLAIITTIDYDHQDYLGTTLDVIGREKAGILRAGKPFIYADNEPPKTILQRAEQLNVPSFLYGKEFSFDEQDSTWDFKTKNHEINQLNKPKIQLKSASAALMSCSILQSHLPVSSDSVHEAMNHIFVPGRLQLQSIKHKNIQLLYDVSHNPQSAQLLAKTIKTKIQCNKVHAVFSALKDKDIAGLLAPMNDCVDYWYVAQLDNFRAASPDYLLSQCKKAEIKAKICYTSPLVAFEEALTKVDPGDLIVVFGSFLTVSQVLGSTAPSN